MAKKSIEPVGSILLKMEPLLEKLVDDHNLQWYDVLFLVFGWLMVHRPDAQEEYEDGTRPVFFYSHLKNLKAFLKKRGKQ
jgi:hypothetical protein